MIGNGKRADARDAGGAGRTTPQATTQPTRGVRAATPGGQSADAEAARRRHGHDTAGGPQRPPTRPVTRSDVRRAVAVGCLLTAMLTLGLLVGGTALSSARRRAEMDGTLSRASDMIEQSQAEVRLSPPQEAVERALASNVNLTVTKGAAGTDVSRPAANDSAIGAAPTTPPGAASGDVAAQRGTDGHDPAQGGIGADGGPVRPQEGKPQPPHGEQPQPQGQPGQQPQGQNAPAAQGDRTAPTDGSDANRGTGDQVVHGSGVVITSDGNIVTNLHVVENARSITATIGGVEYAATVTGTDPTSDIATIKVDATGLKVAEFGDSSKARPGQWVMAVGNPYGVPDSVTAGCVSGLHRDVSFAGRTADILYADMVQTDASAVPGNSGGGLYDSAGRLLGLVSIITTSDDVPTGIAYAIPANLLVPIARNLVQGKEASHPVLGVSLGDVPEDVARAAGIEAKGALVTQVTPSGPADSVRITANDVIVAFDGRPVTSSRDLMFRVRASEVGRQVPITVLRGGKEMTFNVRLGSDT